MVVKIAGGVWIKTAFKPLAFLFSWLLVIASKLFQLVEGESGKIFLCFPYAQQFLWLVSVQGWRGSRDLGGGHSTKNKTISIIFILCPGNFQF